MLFQHYKTANNVIEALFIRIRFAIETTEDDPKWYKDCLKMKMLFKAETFENINVAYTYSMNINTEGMLTSLDNIGDFVLGLVELCEFIQREETVMHTF